MYYTVTFRYQWTILHYIPLINYVYTYRYVIWFILLFYCTRLKIIVIIYVAQFPLNENTYILLYVSILYEYYAIMELYFLISDSEWNGEPRNVGM